MLGLIAATLLLAAAAAAPDETLPAPEDQWVCSAAAEGPRQSAVHVAIQVTASGELVATYVDWSPPLATPAIPPGRPAPELAFYFEQAGADGIGPVTGVLATVSSIGGSLDGKRWSVSVDGAGPWQVTVDDTMAMPDVLVNGRTLRYRSAFIGPNPGLGPTDPRLLAALAGAASARVEFLDRRGRVLAFSQYDLTATADRDRLFGAAWSQAEDRTHHLDSCEQATGTPPPVPVP